MVYGTSAHALIQRGKLQKWMKHFLVHGAAGGVGLSCRRNWQSNGR